MDLNDLMNTTPENLAAKQRDALIAHALSILDRAKKAIKDIDGKALDELTFNSPAGDGYGSDNECLNFAYAKKEEVLDIASIFGRIKQLQDIVVQSRSG